MASLLSALGPLVADDPGSSGCVDDHADDKGERYAVVIRGPSSRVGELGSGKARGRT
jgi:hypothetical protein